MASTTNINSLKNKFINVGEIIAPQTGFMKGHGVIIRNGNLISTVAGFIEQTNKLIFIRPLKTRYIPEVGDVIIGRVITIGDKYWNIDIGGQLYSTLALSAIHLPGGIHRRRTELDALEMRKYFQINDLISAEIQSLKNNKNVNLHTRNLKYGKLINGIFIKLNNNLIKRTNKHFISLTKNIGVDIILGNNGFIWITNTKTNDEMNKIMNFSKEYKDYTPFLTPIKPEIRMNICRIRNCLMVLDNNFIQISYKTIMSVYSYTIKNDIKVKDILNDNYKQEIIQDALYIVQQSL